MACSRWQMAGAFHAALSAIRCSPSAIGHVPQESKVPPAGLEPAHPAPEAGALSSELWGLQTAVYHKSLRRAKPARFDCEGKTHIIVALACPADFRFEFVTAHPSFLRRRESTSSQALDSRLRGSDATVKSELLPAFKHPTENLPCLSRHRRKTTQFSGS